MPRGRSKKVEEKIAIKKNYKLETPCNLVLKEKDFDPEKLSEYKWVNRGVYYSGGHRMVCLEVKGKL